MDDVNSLFEIAVQLGTLFSFNLSTPYTDLKEMFVYA